MTHPTPQQSAEMREEFEAHITSIGHGEKLARWPDGQYKHLNVQCMWDGWQAARRSPAGEEVEAVGRCVGCQAEQGAQHASGCEYAKYV